MTLDLNRPHCYVSACNTYRVAMCSPFPLPRRVNSRDLPLPYIAEVFYKGKVVYPYLHREVSEDMADDDDIDQTPDVADGFRYVNTPGSRGPIRTADGEAVDDRALRLRALRNARERSEAVAKEAMRP